MKARSTRWRGRTLAVVVAGFLALTGCGWSGVNSRPLPFSPGNGDGAMTVTVEMENVVNLVPNSEVKVNDVTVGSVRHIAFDNWHARLTIGLEKGVKLPANVQARIGQKSLLGAEYLELAKPVTEPSRGRLKDDAVVPLSNTGRYPETEELFAALSAVLNGGGLSQVTTITRELNHALGGRESDVRDLLKQLNTLIGTLDDQRDQIVTAIEGLNKVSGTFARQRSTLAQALKTLPEAIDILSRERAKLTRTLTNVGDFGDEASELMAATRTSLQHNLEHLRPVLKQLGNAGTALTNFLADATFPFPLEGLIKSAKGDYLNLFLTVDITTEAISRDLLGGISPLDAVYGGLLGSPASPTSTDSGNPLDLNEMLAKLKTSQPSSPTTPKAAVPSPATGDTSDLSGLLDGLTKGLL